MSKCSSGRSTGSSSWNDDKNNRCSMNDIWGHLKDDAQEKKEETGEES